MAKIVSGTEFQHYLKVVLVGVIVFVSTYLYTRLLQIPNPLNKAIADTSVFLMGASMLLSSLCYFFNFFDSYIIYRKYLGLIGFAFGVIHISLSFPALERLFELQTWQEGSFWPAGAGVMATVIFTLMTVVSNSFLARILGGRVWRGILRTGYLAMFFIFIHVLLLKLSRWQDWYNEGMKNLPSMSLIVAVYILLVLLMRLFLLIALRRQKKV